MDAPVESDDVGEALLLGVTDVLDDPLALVDVLTLDELDIDDDPLDDVDAELDALAVASLDGLLLRVTLLDADGVAAEVMLGDLDAL